MRRDSLALGRAAARGCCIRIRVREIYPHRRRPRCGRPLRLRTKAGIVTDEATVLLTGASGFIGRQILASLVAAGRPVIALARHGQSTERGVQWENLDLHDTGSV